MSERDAYSDVGRALRSMLERAAKMNLKPRQARVLHAVLHETATYSRLADRVSQARLANITDLPQRHVRSTLAELADLGLVSYEAGCGRGVRSKVGIPADKGAPALVHVSEDKGAPASVPESTEKRGPAPTEKGDQGWTERRTSTGPPPEKTSEKNTEKKQRRDSQASPDVDASPVARDLCRYFVTEHCRPNSHGVPSEGTKAHATWLREMDRLLRIGPPSTGQGVDPDRIRRVIAWMAGHRGNGDFPGWSAVVESVPKFRKQFTKIAASCDAASRNGSGRQSATQVSQFTYSGRVNP